MGTPDYSVIGGTFMLGICDINDKIPNEWVLKIFDAQQVEKGGIVRRSVSDVQEHATFPMLLNEVKRLGYHLIETGDQFVIFCHTGAMKIHC
ncbi:MAG: hypothetical protein SH868_05555 [Bythopirellula sp.]|nr:hypothetical protein [Bythopirellula sp.]